MQDLKLSVLINAVDKFTGPAKKIATMSDRMAKKLHAGQTELKELAAQGKKMDQFNRLGKRLGTIASKMDQAGKETASLGRKLSAISNPTKTLINQFERAKKKSSKLKKEHRAQKDALGKLRTELRGADIDTRRIGTAQERLANKLQKTTGKMEKLSQMSARAEKAQAKYDRVLQRGANLSLVAGGMAQVGQRALSMVSAPINSMRSVERSRGELSSLGIKDIDAVANKGREMAKLWAYISPARFISSAYDIKSGISGLDDLGVAGFTAQSALTAKATKADLGQMTDLFATGYGTFKESLFSEMGDIEFGAAFSGTLSGAVAQFKTDGTKMQTAIQAMGSGLSESGVSLEQQFTALGMLQQKMQAGVAGTTLKAIERTAAEAQARFETSGLNIQTLDSDGNLRKLPELLEEMQQIFGDQYTTETGAEIQKAFGSDEAVVFFKALWGQQDAFRANEKALKAAQKQGMKFTETMALAMDDNMDARMQKMQQRWDLITERLGTALIPVLERLIPIIEKGADWIEKFMEGNKGLSTGLIAVIGGIGLIATVAAPVIMAISSLSIALAFLAKSASRAQLGVAAGGIGFGGGGKGGKGFLGRTKGFLRGKGGWIGAAIGAAAIGATLLDSGMGAGEKAAAISTDLGGIGGAMGGAALGASIGTAIFPGIGTALGALIGGIGGSSIGGWLGSKVGSIFHDDEKPSDSPITKKMATAMALSTMAATPAVAGDGAAKSITHAPTYSIVVHAAQGMDEEAIAAQVQKQMEQYENDRAAETRSRLYDD